MGCVDRVGTYLLDIIWKKRPLVNEVWLRSDCEEICASAKPASKAPASRAGDVALPPPVPGITSIRVPIRSLSAATWGDDTALAVLTEPRQCF
jgi:hypothetical protein